MRLGSVAGAQYLYTKWPRITRPEQKANGTEVEDTGSDFTVKEVYNAASVMTHVVAMRGRADDGNNWVGQ